MTHDKCLTMKSIFRNFSSNNKQESTEAFLSFALWLDFKFAQILIHGDNKRQM